MKPLLADWIDFCEGRRKFDKSHFLGLVKECHAEPDIEMILQYFPCREVIAKNIRAVFQCASCDTSLYLLPKLVLDDLELLKLASSWLLELSNFFKDSNLEFYDICANIRVQLVEREYLANFIGKDIPNYWFFEFISDCVFDNLDFGDERILYLQDAMYGLAADYYLSFFILTPLIRHNLDFEKYFEFWRGGGIGVFSEKEFLISKIVGL